MRITVDTEREVIEVETPEGAKSLAMGSAEGFAALSKAWLRSGWDVKHVYSFTWFGRPIIQLPEDMIRLQEVVYSVKPDVIIECGVAHGGGAVFYASLCKAMGRGRVIAVDVEIRPHNRKALEEHPLIPLVTLIEASSIEQQTVEQVRSLIKSGEKVFVALDSCHKKDHVLAELRAYGPMVSVGSYIVAMDGIMQDLVGAPRAAPDWGWNNPQQAALEFVKTDDRFEIVEPPWLFNEGAVRERVTYWPNGFIRRVR